MSSSFNTSETGKYLLVLTLLLPFLRIYILRIEAEEAQI
jgi:hypothetical protein